MNLNEFKTLEEKINNGIEEILDVRSRHARIEKIEKEYNMRAEYKYACRLIEFYKVFRKYRDFLLISGGVYTTLSTVKPLFITFSDEDLLVYDKEDVSFDLEKLKFMPNKNRTPLVNLIPVYNKEMNMKDILSINTHTLNNFHILPYLYNFFNDDDEWIKFLNKVEEDMLMTKERVVKTIVDLL